MEGGKTEGVTIGNGSVQVLVQGPFSRHGLAGHFFVNPDVEGGLIAVERIAGHPAITSDDFENYFSGIVDPEDVCVVPVNNGLKNNPSALVSLSYGYLRQQLISPELYEKNAPSHLDALFVRDLSNYID